MNNEILNVGKTSFVHAFQETKSNDQKERISEVTANRTKENDTSNEDLTSFEEAKKLAREGNKILENSQRNLQFKVDDSSKQVVMSIVDGESGEVIRQIPSQDVLDLAKKMIKPDNEPGHLMQYEA